MRYLSRDDIERIAERVWTGYKKLPENRNTFEYDRVEPMKVMTDLLRLKVEFKNLSKDPDIMGLTSFEEMGIEIYNHGKPEIYELDGKTVLIDDRLDYSNPKAANMYMIWRKNFTMMHEGAHQILKMLFPKDYGADSQQVHFYIPNSRRTPEEWGEWQADALATALLMPREVLERNIKKFWDTHHDRVIRLYRSEMWREDILPLVKMSYSMGVSRWAMGCRMKYLGIIDGFDDNY